MYYAECLNSWANYEDLVARFGAEFIDKLGTRTVYDDALKTYVADESRLGRLKVIDLALEDARAFLLKRLGCLYKGLSDLDFHCFSIVKQWHIKLTIETLKVGGDCGSCFAFIEALDKELPCVKICDDSGKVCLKSVKSFSFVSKARFGCEQGGCGC